VDPRASLVGGPVIGTNPVKWASVSRTHALLTRDDEDRPSF
jgi:hypothetical protein